MYHCVRVCVRVCVCGCAERGFSVCVFVCVCVRVATMDWHKRCPLLDWDVISSDLA